MEIVRLTHPPFDTMETPELSFMARLVESLSRVFQRP